MYIIYIATVIYVLYITCIYIMCESHSVMSDSAIPWAVCNLPGSSVHGTLQTEYRSGYPFPSPEDLPNPEIKSRSPALQVDSLPSEPPE